MNDPATVLTTIDISIIIVTYNSEQEIVPCLNSLANQQGDLTCEIIIIDNASGDRTVQAIQSAIQSLPFVHVIYNASNIGFTRAVNQGLEHADGEFLLLLNPDIVMPPHALFTLLTRLKQHPTAGAVAPQFLNSDGETIQPSCRRFPRLRDVWYHILGLPWLLPGSREFNGWKMGDFDHTSDRCVQQPQGAFLLISREVFEQVGLLDEMFPMFFSDVDLCRRIADHGWDILFLSSVAVIHHKGHSIVKRKLPLIWSSHYSFFRYFWKYNRSLFSRIGTIITGGLLVVLGMFRSGIYMIRRGRKSV